MKRKNEEESLLVTKKPNLQNSSSSEEFTIAAFLSTLKNSFEAYSGLQKFHEASLLVKNNEQDIVKEFLVESSNCELILQYLTFSTSELNMLHVYKSLTAILLRTADDLSKEFSKKGLKLSSTLINKHLATLIKPLRYKNSSVTVAILELLTAIVMQGCDIALELLHALITKKSAFLMSYSNTENEEYNGLVRLGLVRFAVSFLIGNSAVTAEVLDTGFLDFVFLQIHKDQSAFCIHLLLSTFLDKVVKFRRIKKSTKRHFLTRPGVLSSIGLVLKWNGKMDIASGKDQDNSFIHKLAYHFLFVCCCSSKLGIISAIPYEESSRLENDFILGFLLGLNKDICSNDLTVTLVAKIFKTLPDLLKHYFNSTKLNFTPSSTVQWFKNCDFLHEIYKMQPDIPQVLQYYSAQPNAFAVSNLPEVVNMVLPEILMPIERTILTAIISHTEPNVQIQGLKVITHDLTKLEFSIDFLKNKTKQNVPKEMYNLLRNEVKKHIPSSKTIVDVWKLICKRNVTDELEVEALKLLHLYQKVFFDCFDSKAFDFYELFVGLIQVSHLESGKQSLLHLFSLVLESPQSCNWFHVVNCDQTLFDVVVTFTLELMQNSACNPLLDKAVQLLISVFESNKLVSHDDSAAEICIWLHYLGACSKSTDGKSKSVEKRNVKDFFVKAALSVVETTSSSFKLRQIMEEIKNGQIDKQATSWFKDLVETETNLIKSGGSKKVQVCRISRLMISVFEQLSNTDSSNQALDTDIIDRFICDALSDLFYRQTIIFHFAQFASFVSLLFAEIKLQSRFPLLSDFCQNMSTHCLSLTLINSEVHKETRKTVFVSISKQAATFPSLDDFVIQVFCTEMKQHFTETWISRAMFYIIGLTALSKSTSKVKTVTKLLKSFTDKLKTFLRSHKFLLESERSNKIDSSVENKGPQSEPCGSSLSNFNSKNFTDLLEKLERSNILRHIFLHPGHCKLISEPVNELIVEVLCLYFQTYPEISSSFYKDKLIYVMARSFLNESQLEDDNLTELVFLCFLKFHPWLDQSHLVETLIRGIDKASQVSDERIISCICLCLEGLAEQDFRLHPVVQIQKLFSVFLKSSSENQLSLLSHFDCFLTKNSSLALCAHKDVIKWCLDHFAEEKSMKLLQTLVTYNQDLLKYFVQLCSKDESRSLIEQSSSYKSKLSPVLLSLVTLRSLHDDDTKNNLTNLISTSYSKKLVSKLLKNKLKENQVDMLLWLMNTKNLSSKSFEKISTHLCNLIEDDFHFSQSWKLALGHLKLLDDCKETDLEKSFCVDLINSLMRLSCNFMQKQIGSIDVVVNSLHHLLLRCHLHPDHYFHKSHDFQVWKDYVRTSLKYEIENNHVLRAIKIIMKISADLSWKIIDLRKLHAMLTNHSKFLDILLSDKTSDTKFALLQLLYKVLLSCDSDVLQSRDLAYLLSSYNATLSRCDQTVFKIIQLYELKGVNAHEYKPYLWGKHAVKFYINQNYDSSEASKTTLTQAYDAINKQLMESTLKKFALDRRLNIEPHCGDDEELSEIDDDPFRYDPAFLLHFIFTLLDTEDNFVFSRFIQSGLLSFLFLSLSSHCKNIRHLSAHCLLMFEDRVKAASSFRLKELLTYVLDMVRRSMRKMLEEGSIKRQFTVSTLFLSHAAQLMVNNSHVMFVPVFEHLLQTNHFNMAMIPNFKRTFFSRSMNHEVKRNWTLVLISDGMRDHSDYHHSETHQLFQVLMSYFSSSLCPKSSKQLILHIIEKACSFRYSALDLVAKQAVLPWLSGLVFDCASSKLDNQDDVTAIVLRMHDVSMVLNSLWNTFASFRNWMTDHVEFFRSRVLPQLLDLCFDIFDLILIINDKLRNDDTVRQSRQLFSTLVKVASEILSLEEAESVKRFNQLLLSDKQSVLLRTASAFLKDKPKLLKYSICAMLKWLPLSKCDYDQDLITSNLIWLIETWNSLRAEVSANESRDVLQWIHAWISLLHPVSTQVKRSLLLCYEILCQLPADSTSNFNDYIVLFRSIVNLLLLDPKKSDDDNDKLLRLARADDMNCSVIC